MVTKFECINCKKLNSASEGIWVHRSLNAMLVCTDCYAKVRIKKVSKLENKRRS